MEGPRKKQQENKKITEVKTFPVPFALGEIRENISISTNTPSQFSKESIIVKAFKFHSQGNLKEAAKYYQFFINQGFSDPRVFSNYGVILKQRNEIELAIKLYKMSIDLFPSSPDAYTNIGSILKEIGNLKEAEIYTRKAIELNPKSAEAHNNLGAILERFGKLQEAEKCTRKAIEIDPSFAMAYSNLGGILNDLGNTKVAEINCRKAIELDPNLVDSRITLDNIAKKEVPQWHIPMINDKERANAYLKAIKLAINHNQNVLEIGTGSGLLSMMAIDAGAKTVVTCESSKKVAEVARKIISKNGYSEKIKVLNKNSSDIIIGKDLNQKADLIISEILSSEFVGENVQPTILDARKRLLKENGKMIPEFGYIKAALIESNSEIEEKLFVTRVNNYDLSRFNSITGGKFNLSNLKSNTSFLSKKEIIFSFDFYQMEQVHKQDKIIEVYIEKDGLCLGLVTWIKLDLYKDVSLENDPSKTNNSHWGNPIYTFHKPLQVSKGQVMKIKSTLLQDNIWFELID